MGLPGRPRAARRREGCVVVLLGLLLPAPRLPCPLGRRCLSAERCWLQMQPGTGWPTTPQPGPRLPPAGHCLRAPRPRRRGRRDPRPDLSRPKVLAEGESARGVERPAAAPDARGSLRLPQVHPTGCRRRRRCSCRGVLGAAAGVSQVSRKTESAGRAPGKGCGWGRLPPGSPGVRLCVAHPQRPVRVPLWESGEELAEPLCLRFTVHCSTYSTCNPERLKTLILYKAVCHWSAP